MKNNLLTRPFRWKNFGVMVLLGMGLTITSMAQTTLINPSGDGGFESGTTLTANGWTAVNAATDGWVAGTTPVQATGDRCAYVSSNGGGNWLYSQLSTVTHIYRDFTVPAGEGALKLTFKWKALGEGTTTSDWDNLKIFLAATTYTPTTSAVTGATQLAGPGAISNMYKLSSASWNNDTITFAGTPGTSYRLIFSWKSDVSTIANPPAALDDIGLISRAPETFVSTASGNWNAAATWVGGSAPSAADNATIAAGHTVTVNAIGLAINDLTVAGTLAYNATPTSFAVNGNLTVNNGGLANIFSTTTGKTITVAGNIVNNGEINLSVGSTTAGVLTLNGTDAQTISGSGTFTNGFIRNLTCSNTSTATPNITWSAGNITVAYNLNLTGARMSLGSNTLTFGNLAAPNTLTCPTGTGILPGGTFSRWWTTGATGSAFTAGANPTTTTSMYPFVNADGQNRKFWIRRSVSTTTGNTAGPLAVKYNDASTTSTGLSINDNGYLVTNRFNGNWEVSSPGAYVYVSGSHQVAIQADFVFAPKNGNTRIISSAGIIDTTTHQNGTITPGSQRLGFNTAALTDGPIHIGIGSSDLNMVTIASGNWNNAAIWSSGSVPTCSDTVVINPGHTVTVNSASNNAQHLTVSSGATLNVSSGDLTVGCTNRNNLLSNSGTLSVSGGTLNVNGQLLIVAASTFTQSGGNINVDGNNGGVDSTSVPSGTAIVQINSHLTTLSGGTLTIIDPHATASTSNNTLAYSTSSGHINATGGHTLQLGNGSSSDRGGDATSGFRLNTFVGSSRISFDNVILNCDTGTNRHVSTVYSWGVNNLTINTNSELRQSTQLYVAGNLVNNGTLVSTSTLQMSQFLSGSSSASTTAQSISGSGTFVNSATSSTANISSLAIVNTNASGVTLNVPIRISGTLTLTAGKLNTTSSNIVTVGTTTAAGTVSGGNDTSFVNGPMVRTFAASRTASGTYTTTTLFPVGKGSAYAPIHIDPSTNAGGAVEISSEFFGSHSGTAGAGVSNLSTVNWSTSATSGAANLVNVFGRIAHSAVTATSKLLHASTANGVYSGTPGGSISSGIGGTVTTSAAIAVADILGFYAYGDLTPCTAPTDTATAFVTSLLTTTTFTGSFSAAAGSPTGYMVVRYATTDVPTLPVDGVVYSGAALGGTVVGNLTSAPFTFTQTGLTANTSYDYRVYSYNNSGCAGPTYLTATRLNATVTTCAVATGASGTPVATNRTTSAMTISFTNSATASSTYFADVATNSGFTSFLSGYEGFSLGTDTSFNLSSLSAGTTYYVRIRAVNSNCVSAFSSTLTTTTLCNPVTSFPYSQNFSSFLPSVCWEQGKTGNLTTGPSSTSSSNWTADGFLNSGTTGAAKLNLYSTSDLDWLISEQYVLPAGTNKLKYKIGVTQWNSTSAPTTAWESDDSIYVAVNVSGNSNWTVVKTYGNTNVPSHLGQTDSVDLSDYENDTIKIAFITVEGVTDGSADVDIFIDDMSIEALGVNTWNGTGLWNNVSNWSLGIEPASEKSAIIATGTVTTDANTNVKALTINSGAAVVVDAGHVMTVTGGITNNGTLTVKATSASVYGQLMVSGTTSGSGSSKFERAVTGSTAGWRLLSSPTNANFNSFGPSPVFTGAANILKLNTNSPNAWDSVSSVGTTTVETGRGYLVYLGNGGVNNNATSHTFNLIGTTLNTANVSVSGLSDGNGTNTFGWSVVGNPFGTNLTWDTSANTRTNIDNAYYVWDATSGGGTGAYASYVAGVSSPSGVLSNYIAPLQGFLVKANAASPALTLAAGSRNTGMNNAQLRTSNLFDILRLRATEANGSRWDEATFVSRSGATAAFDSEYDAFKLMNFDATAPNLFSKASSGEVLSINAFPEITGTVTIPVHFVTATNGNYSITLDAAQLGNQHTVTLEDLKTGVRHDMRSGAYNFAHLTTNANDRFMLHLNASTVSVNNGTDNPVRVYTYNNHLYVNGLREGELVKSLRVLDITGKVVVNETALNADEVRERPLQLPAGTYMIQVVTDMGIKNVKVILGM